MGRARVLVLVLALVGLPAVAAAESAPEPGRLIDLTGDLAADLERSDSWAGPTELTPCAWAPWQALFGTFRVGALFLTRDHPKAQPVSRIVGAIDEAPLWDATDLGLGTRSGLDLTFLVALSNSLDLGVRYFGIVGWNTSQTVGDPSGVTFNGFGLAITDQTERVAYSSRLYNIEVNIRPRVTDKIPLVLGFRHIQLHEYFDVWRLEPVPEAVDLSSHTRNYLYGFQLGAEPNLYGGGTPLNLGATIKAGVYGNHASQSTFSPLSGNAVEVGHNRTSFVGEAGLNAAYKFGRYFTIRGGYEVFWLYGVALAPDQSTTTDLFTPAGRLYDKSAALLHGATVALEFAF